jgi:hypothetical protein
MRIPKKYGMSKDSHCPFCNKLAIAKNKEGIEVCIDHKNKKLDDIKCTCGSWLEQRVGKFGAYYNCINCGNINFNKAMEIKNIMMLKEQKNKEKKQINEKKETTDSNKRLDLRQQTKVKVNEIKKKDKFILDTGKYDDFDYGIN